MYLPGFIAGQSAALDVAITSPLQASLISDAGRTCGFALTLAEDKDWALLPEVHRYGHPLPTIGVRNFRRTIRSKAENIEKNIPFTDNRGFQPSGLSVAFNRLT